MRMTKHKGRCDEPPTSGKLTALRTLTGARLWCQLVWMP